MAFVDSVYADTGPKKNSNPKPVIEYLEFEDKSIRHHRDRLNEVPQAYVNIFDCLTKDDIRYYRFSISTIGGDYRATTTNPDIAKYMASCYIDDKPFSLLTNF